jgi:hypothetical protein
LKELFYETTLTEHWIHIRHAAAPWVHSDSYRNPIALQRLLTGAFHNLELKELFYETTLTERWIHIRQAAGPGSFRWLSEPDHAKRNLLSQIPFFI